MPAIKISDRNVEKILKNIIDNQLAKCSFGTVVDFFNRNLSFKPQQPERLRAYFDWKEKQGYTLVVEAADSSNPCDNPAKFEIDYFSKMPITTGGTFSCDHPADLECVYNSIQLFRPGLQPVADALGKAGFVIDSGGNHHQTYFGEVVFANQLSYTRIDLREVPDGKRWNLEVKAKIYPVFKS